jgi:hypothetical protein
MITLKTKREIQDSTVNRIRSKGEIFQVTEERLKQIQSAIKFDAYFEVVKIEKKVVEPVVEKKTTRRRKTDK